MSDSRTGPGPPGASFRRLIESGVFLSAAGVFTQLGNGVFQGILGRQLSAGEYGLANSTLIFASYLALPLAIATQAVTHYIARFTAHGEDARLQGLLAGCRRFLFHLTIAGSVLAVALVKPLNDFFHFPRATLMLTVVVSVLAGLWGSYATALCQGLAWFKRLALIGILAMLLRLAFGTVMTLQFPVAEMVVLASGLTVLANLVLLFWKSELFGRGAAISPWDREFVQFLVVSAACVGAGSLFGAGDMLVAKRYFSADDLGAYAAAQRLAAALPGLVAPLLTVLFTHRSGAHTGHALREHLKFLALYAVGLVCGAVCLLLLRNLGVHLIFGKAMPASAAMVGRLGMTMVFVGLLQSLGLWALASRWLKLALMYGALGLLYWLTLLWLGRSPGELLSVMPLAAGIAFGALFVFWLLAVRSTGSDGPPGAESP